MYSSFLALTLGASTALGGGAEQSPNSRNQLKTAIVAIAERNNGRFDNPEEVRGQLEPIIAELIGGPIDQTVTRPAGEDIELMVGAWKELWSDDRETTAPGLEVDRDATYQVITSEGYFYNVSELVAGSRFAFTGFLRGTYTDAGDYLEIEFTDVSGRPVPLATHQSLTDLVHDVENGITPTFPRPVGGAGPVGQRGRIRNLYIDDALRIAYGRNFANQIDDIYILRKVHYPERLSE